MLLNIFYFLFFIFNIIFLNFFYFFKLFIYFVFTLISKIIIYILYYPIWLPLVLIVMVIVALLFFSYFPKKTNLYCVFLPSYLKRFSIIDYIDKFIYDFILRRNYDSCLSHIFDSDLNIFIFKKLMLCVDPIRINQKIKFLCFKVSVVIFLYFFLLYILFFSKNGYDSFIYVWTIYSKDMIYNLDIVLGLDILNIFF